MKIVLLHYIFLFRSQSIFCNVLSSEYNHSAFLDATEKYQFFWTVDKSAKKISFAVEVKTSGWVGFGFSAGLAGKMEGADMVVGWISADGKAHSSVSAISTIIDNYPSMLSREESLYYYYIRSVSIFPWSV